MGNNEEKRRKREKSDAFSIFFLFRKWGNLRKYEELISLLTFANPKYFKLEYFRREVASQIIKRIWGINLSLPMPLGNWWLLKILKYNGVS